MNSSHSGTRSEGSSDAGYENRVEIISDAGRLRVRKTFRRRERFVAEVRATLILQESGMGPRLTSVCDDNLVLVREWVPGAPIQLHGISATVVGQHIEALATCLKRLHACRAPGWGPLERTPASGWLEYLRSRFALRLSQASPALDADEQLRDWALARMQCIPVPDVARLLHHDLKPANILILDNRITLVDMEHATGGDPLSDLAKLKWRAFACDDRLWRLFSKAYGGAEHDGVFERTVDLYLAMHCLGAIAYGVSSANRAYARHVASAKVILARLLAADHR